jgi:hypothetical protein
VAAPHRRGRTHVRGHGRIEPARAWADAAQGVEDVRLALTDLLGNSRPVAAGVRTGVTVGDPSMLGFFEAMVEAEASTAGDIRARAEVAAWLAGGRVAVALEWADGTVTVAGYLGYAKSCAGPVGAAVADQLRVGPDGTKSCRGATVFSSRPPLPIALEPQADGELKITVPLPCTPPSAPWQLLRAKLIIAPFVQIKAPTPEVQRAAKRLELGMGKLQRAMVHFQSEPA